MPENNYILISTEKVSPDGPWVIFWRPDRRGYTDEINEAGLYSLKQTQELASPTSFGVPELLAYSKVTGSKIHLGRMEAMKNHPEAVRYVKRTIGLTASIRLTNDTRELEGTWCPVTREEEREIRRHKEHGGSDD